MTRFPTKFAAAAIIALMPRAAPAIAQTSAQGTNATVTADQTPLLAFSITEEIKSTPDRVSIGAGVSTVAPTAQEAVRQNATQMSSVIAALRRAGIAERDIQTSGFNLSAQYDYSNRSEGQPPSLTGYQATNMVTVKSNDINRTGALIDALVAAGGNNISGPEFSLANADSALDGARTAALRRANERAQFYAQAAGYRSARLVSLSEGAPVNRGPVPMMARMAADSAGAATPVMPGEVANSVTVSVEYRLER